MTSGSPSDLAFESARSLAERIRTGDLSPVDVVDVFLDRIDRIDPAINAFVTVCDEEAREGAREAQDAIERGDDLGPLHGVPVAIKDLNRVRGVRTTFGSPVFADHVPDRDDVTVARLREAGAIILGKTNTPEFGRKTVTDNPVFGKTCNPWDPDKVTGGSSGGSAAAVAAGLAPLALGTDAAGSIRIPSAACGVVGIFPDFGRVPTGPVRADAFENLLPYTTAGPIARSVADAALMLEVMAGPDRRDPQSLPQREGSYLDELDTSIDDVEIGYVPDFDGFRIDSAVREVVEEALADVESAGATVTEVDLPYELSWTERHDALEWILQTRYVGLYENFKRDGVVDLLETDLPITPEVQSRIRKGLKLDTATLAEARRRRTAEYDVVQSALDDVDVLATPTLGCTASDHGINEPTVDGEAVHPMHGWTLTWPLNLTGNPAVSLPAGFAGDLPVGLQLIGDRHADNEVVAVGAGIERQRPWHDAYPPTSIGGTQ